MYETHTATAVSFLPLHHGIDREPWADVAAPTVPVLTKTLVYAEWLLQQRVLDLHRLTECLRRDPGAVLRVFALLAAEFPHPEARPERLEICLASLQAADLREALQRPTAFGAGQQVAVRYAEHSFAVARSASAVAGTLHLPGEHAFLLGLLHAVPELLRDLRRAQAGDGRDHALAAECRMFEVLPRDLQVHLAAVHADEDRSIWTAVLRAAHDLVTREEERVPARWSKANPNHPYAVCGGGAGDREGARAR